MREIKFRGKAHDDGRWLYGSLDYRQWYSQICQKMFILTKTGCEEVRYETVGQFTGLYDRYGKEIYESDIVETERGRLCVVEWFSSNSYQGWDLKPIYTEENLKYEAPRLPFLWKKDYIKVVGNIYDNPELLEEKINGKSKVYCYH